MRSAHHLPAGRCPGARGAGANGPVGGSSAKPPRPPRAPSGASPARRPGQHGGRCPWASQSSSSRAALTRDDALVSGAEPQGHHRRGPAPRAPRGPALLRPPLPTPGKWGAGPWVGPARAPGLAQAGKTGPAVSPAAARAAGSALRLRASVRVAKGRAAVFPPPGPRKRWYGSGFRPREGTAQRGPRMGDLAPAGVPGNCPRLRSCSFPDAAGVGWGRVGVASGSRALRPEGRVVLLGAASERSRESMRPRRKAGPGPGTV